MNKTKWKIEFNLVRDNETKNEDNTWFDKSHIKSEIITWLEDLDYQVKDIKIKKIKFQKMRQNLNFLNTPRKLSITKLNEETRIKNSSGFGS